MHVGYTRERNTVVLPQERSYHGATPGEGAMATRSCVSQTSYYKMANIHRSMGLGPRTGVSRCRK